MQGVTARPETNMPVIESAFLSKDALKFIHLPTSDWIYIKLLKTGGIYQAEKYAPTAGANRMIHCKLETEITASTAAHFAPSQ